MVEDRIRVFSYSKKIGIIYFARSVVVDII